MDYVYHASPIQNLKELRPKQSMDRGSYVFASPGIEVAAAFLGRDGYDFACGIGHDKNSNFYICERFEDALEYRYGKPGSIYFLDSKNFKIVTSWGPEVGSDKKEKVLKEIKISKSLDYLLELQEIGLVRIYEYPDRPDSIPKDDSDLVNAAVKYFNKDIIKSLKKYHPNLIQKVLEKI